MRGAGGGPRDWEREPCGQFSGSSICMSCFRTVLSVLCVGAAVPSVMSGQAGDVRPETPTTWQGIGLRYGAILPGGLTIYRQLGDRSTEGNWATLSVAASVTREVSLAFSTTAWELTPGLDLSMAATADLFHDTRFYGMGSRLGDRPIPIERNRYSLAPTFTVARNSNVGLSFGPILEYTASRFDLDEAPVPDGETGIEGTEPYGLGGFGQLGVQAGIAFNSAIRGPAPGSMSATLGASAFPAMLDVVEPFAELHGELRGVFLLSAPGSPTLALRAGGKKIWGAVPIHEAAFLGGSASLRALPSRSLVGDAAVYGGAELRFGLGSAKVGNRTVRYGFLGLADVGRLFYNGVPWGGWLSEVGGGLWLEPAGFGRILTVGAATGPLGTRFFVGAGM